MPGNGTVLPWGVRPAEAAAQPLAAMPPYGWGVSPAGKAAFWEKRCGRLCKPIGRAALRFGLLSAERILGSWHRDRGRAGGGGAGPARGAAYLTATHDRENPGSDGVMRKLGMVYQYSYEEQWQPKDIRVVFRLYQMNLDGQERSYRGYWDRNPVHFVEPGLGRE